MRTQFFAALLLAVVAFSKAEASVPSACQMRMLTLATQAYNQDFGDFSQLFRIEDISFEDDLKGNAAVAFSGQSGKTGESCLTRVKLVYPEGHFGCPNYEFNKVETICN